MEQSSSTTFIDSKKHYVILDGLRGVAAVIVVMFHLLETFAEGSNLKQIINHGYMAVDFFFVLSGFVIGYAYDDRWNKMSISGFFKRRLIRLHPMIIIGMLIGAILFYFQASPFFPGISGVPIWHLLAILLAGFFLIPVPPSWDIRGWWEMYPLNGPAWTLFFEYIANILYALILRKLSNRVIAIIAFIAGAFLIHLSVFGPNGDIIGGWSLEPLQIYIGFTRLLYPFLAGLLLSRLVKPAHINNSFIWCSLLLTVILAVPRIGGSEHLWMNGIYDAVCIIILFPLIVYMGASGELTGKYSTKICKFLGDISYPIYIIHYPIIYTFMSWVGRNKITLIGSLPMAFACLILSIILAYGSLKLYDEPVRKWLTKKIMTAAKK